MKCTLSATLFWIIFFLATPLFSQHEHLPGEECLFTRKMEKEMEKDPDLRRMVDDYKNNILPSVARDYTKNRSMAAPIIRVPIVVHIIHNPGELPGEGQNLSDAQVQAQIDVLNEDFSATNPNFGDTPARWAGDVGNPEIQFCLASIDPNGNPTTGIVRHSLEVTVDNNGNDNIESEIKPLVNWDANNYYNIYTLPIPGTTAAGGTTGYAYLPYPGTVGDGTRDGSVVDYRWFGGPGFSQSGYKTLTHETGHYLGLFHPFGDNSCTANDCAEDDGLTDTPNIDRPTSCFSGFSCNSGFPTGPTSCGNEHMYINYMDYSRSSCKTSFTNDQISIMRAVLDGTMNQYNWASRLPLASNALSVCTFNTNDAAVAEILNPGGFLCDTGMVTPEVTITNFGVDPLTTVNINYQVNNDPVVTFVWIDNLPSGGSTVVSLPTFTPPAGTFTFTAYTTLPNGMPDENTANDTLSVQSTGVVSFPLPLIEDFEDAAFNPTTNGVFNFNPDQDTFTWQRNDNFSSFGNPGACAVFDNYNTIGGENPGGKIDALITQIYDFSNTQGATLTFDLAYAAYDNSFFDSLIVLASTNCATNYDIELYRNGNSGMGTAPNTTSPFVPSATQWRTETIDLSAFDNTDNFSVAFINFSGYGNLMYIDNIRISPPCLITATNTIVDVDCNGACTGSATVVPDGGTGIYTYAWDANAGNQTAATATGLCAGTYNVTITDDASCSAVIEVIINEPDALTVTMGGTNPTGVSTNDGMANALPAGGNDNCYDYLWSNLGTTSTIDNLPPGTYIVTVTDCSGCVVIDSVTLDPIDCSNFDFGLQVVDVLCNGQNTGEILVSPSGGPTPFTYVWDNPALSGPNPTGLMAGTYPFTVSDATGCSLPGVVTITEPPALNASLSSTPISMVGAMDGSVSVSAMGGTAPYNYDWGIIGTGSTITGLGAGFYTVTVTDANGCSAVFETVIDEIDCNNFAITGFLPIPPTCNSTNDGIIEVAISGGNTSFTYTWEDLPAPLTTNIRFGLGAGTYCVTVTDNLGCTDNSCTSITEPEVLSVSFSGETNLTCFGELSGPIQALVSGGTQGYQYTWDPPQSPSGPIVEDLVAGLYVVTVTDGNGCSVINEFEINQPAELTAILSSTPETTSGANDGSATAAAMGGTPGYTYDWGNAGTGPTVSNLVPGVYEVTITDANGCTLVESVVVPAGNVDCSTLEVDLIYSSSISCNGGADGVAQANVTGGTTPYSIVWENSDTGPITSTGLSAGIITVTITDANNCILIDEIEITEPAPISVVYSIINESAPGAMDGGITATASGGTPGYTYDWMNPTTGPLTGPGISNLSAGDYSLIVTDANGCSYNEVIVLETTPVDCSTLDLVLNGTNPFCNQTNDGTAEAIVTGGQVPYDIVWSNSDTGSMISGLSGGIYVVTVTDANGCSIVDEIELVSPPELIVGITSVNESAPGASDGSISAAASGGTPGYIYDWNNPVTGPLTGPTISNLSAGIYTLIVTDANGCSAVEEYLLETDNIDCANFFVTIISTPETCPEANDGVAEALPVGGTAPYTYMWGNGDTGPISSNLESGLVIVTVTDANNCVFVAENIINEPDTLVINIAVTPESGPGASDGEILLGIVGGTPPFTYDWADLPSPTDPEDRVGLAGGTYMVTVTDANGCSVVETITVPTGSIDCTTLSGAVTTTNVSCFGASDGTATVFVQGGLAPYSYSWITGDTTVTIINQPFGVVLVEITDANGCTAVAEGFVEQPDVLQVLTSVTNESGVGTNDGSITATASGGTPPYAYDWGSAGMGPTIDNLPSGTYEVTVTDANGCTEITTATVFPGQVDCSGFSGSVSTSPVTCPGDADGEALLNLTGGTAPFTIEWGNGDNTDLATNLSGGVIGVTITDANNCFLELEGFVDEDPPIEISIFSTNETVAGQNDGTAAASATGGTPPYTYDWGNAGTGPGLINLAPGVYVVTVTDGKGCTAVETVEIMMGQPGCMLASSISSVNILCNGLENGSATVSVTGGTPPYTYLWSSGATGATANNLPAGLVTVTITDAANCTWVDEVVIEEPEPLEVATTSTNETLLGAADGSVSAMAAGGTAPYIYDWGSAGMGQTITGLAPGVYVVLVTDARGCTIQAEAIVEEGPVDCSGIILEFQTIDVSCNGLSDGYAEVFVSGGFGAITYEWINSSSTISSITGPAGTYFVLITDSLGCEVEGMVEIMEPAVLEVVAFGQDGNCGGNASAIADVAGGVSPYTYLWSTGETTKVINDLLPGNYSVTVTDTNGCTDSGETNVVVNNTGIDIEVDKVNVSCFGESDGSIGIAITSGTPPYEIEWSNNATGTFLDNLPEGTYNVQVTDAAGCVYLRTITIESPAPISINVATSSSDPTLEDGTATANASGGVPPYSYLWNTGDQGPVARDLAAGTYEVTVTDANGCTAVQSFDIYTTGVENIASLTSWNVFPNPSAGLFKVQATFIENEDFEVVVYNILGQTILRSAEQGKVFDFPIDLQDMPVGTYYLQLKTNKGQLVQPLLLTR